jgi:hypothetical protein
MSCCSEGEQLSEGVEHGQNSHQNSHSYGSLGHSGLLHDRLSHLFSPWGARHLRGREFGAGRQLTSEWEASVWNDICVAETDGQPSHNVRPH